MNTNVKEKMSSQQFNELCLLIPNGKYKEFYDDITHQMGWGRTTFYKKRRGDSNLTNPESLLAEKIFEKYGVRY